MDCNRVAELLPWLMNGMLEAADQQQVREHLAQCNQCQRELNETILAWTVYQQHVPTEALIDYAFGQPVVTIQADLIERNLKTCRECAEQLELVRESRRLEREEVVEVRPVIAEKPIWGRALRWQYAALAASLIGAIAVGGWLWSWQQATALRASLTKQQTVMRERLASLEAENQRLQQAEAQLREQQSRANREIAQLQQQVEELVSPELNVPVLDLYPTQLTQRAERRDVNELKIPRGAKVITLILNSQGPPVYENYSVEIKDSKSKIVWSAQGLVRHPAGDYTISMPTELLPLDRLTLVVYGGS